ncbi:MAG: type II toxin-antitoxin system Phd/YefM family antitoxin [Hyphomicrobium aestuarii]|nr:type II toxin-antitoxin system Phd/YefM family antitoxin [Hyphomicrobium aestuarii]
MITVNMLEAKSNLSRLVEAVESGAEREIVIARNGKPAARLVPIRVRPTGPRIGAAKIRWAEASIETPMPDPVLEAEAADLFNALSERSDTT